MDAITDRQGTDLIIGIVDQLSWQNVMCADQCRLDHATFGGLPTVTYNQNIGALMVTGIGSRYVLATAGAILIVLGLCPNTGDREAERIENTPANE